MAEEVKIVNEFDQNNHHFKIGVSADGHPSWLSLPWCYSNSKRN